MSLTDIQKIRLEVGDTDVSLPILSDAEYTYFLEKNNSSIRRAGLDAAKTILFKLSMRVHERVDIFEIRGQQAAQNYIQALKLYIRSPDLNTVLQNAQGYAGGISLQDMQDNDGNSDNNIIKQPSGDSANSVPSNFFEV
jgi:hypothetical protein